MSQTLPDWLYSLESRLDFAEQLPGCQLAIARFNSSTAPSVAAFAELGLAAPRAHPKRQCEFLAGRHCARFALQQLGIDGIPGQQEHSRQPLWPVTACGSITHSHGRAAALVGKREHWLGLGLDLEREISPDRAQRLARSLLTPVELEHFTQLDSLAAAHWLTLAFSAKESLFKALNPHTGIYFGFQDARLTGWQDGILRMSLCRELAPGFGPDFPIAGLWSSLDDCLLTVIALPA